MKNRVLQDAAYDRASFVHNLNLMSAVDLALDQGRAQPMTIAKGTSMLSEAGVTAPIVLRNFTNPRTPWIPLRCTLMKRSEWIRISVRKKPNEREKVRP